MKFSLSDIKSGKLPDPVTVLLFGKDGIGKSSWAADAPGVVFIDIEHSTTELDVNRLPLPSEPTLQDVNDCVDWLTNEQHDFQTVSIDTVDWLEPLIWRHVVQTRPGKEIESIEDYGYGKGYVYAVDAWRAFLAKLEKLQRVRRMNIILLAHGAIRTFENPEGDNYDRYELKLHKSAAGLLREWPGAVLFATHEIAALRPKGNKLGKAKGLGNGTRVVYTDDRPAFAAKNRYGLPFELPLSWEAFWSKARGTEAETAAQVAERILANTAGTELEAKAARGVESFKSDIRKLRTFENYLKNQAKVTETENGE